MSSLILIVSKRAYGTGRLLVKHGAWYGRWRTPEGKRASRKLGPVRQGRGQGLTKTQAEAAAIIEGVLMIGLGVAHVVVATWRDASNDAEDAAS